MGAADISCGFARRGKETDIGGLEVSLEDCDGVVLGCDITEVFGATGYV